MKIRLSHQNVDRIQNILIVGLVLCLFVLVGQTEMFRQLYHADADPIQVGGQEAHITRVFSRTNPDHLLIQNQKGRWGTQYDPVQIESLYQQKHLKQLLIQALTAMSPPKKIQAENWKQAVLQPDSWVCYTFPYNISFAPENREQNGAGRLFFLTSRSSRVDKVYYQDDFTGAYYMAVIRDLSVQLPPEVETLSPNGGRFVFEESTLSQSLPESMIILDHPPVCPVYRASNPLSDMGNEERDELLRQLSFNPQTAAATGYQADGAWVIPEGANTLRIQDTGVLTFHGSETGEALYQALSSREKDLQREAEDLLDMITKGRLGEGTMVCRNILKQKDGKVEIQFDYVLHGAKVHLWDEGWSASFQFRDRNLISFFVGLRRYEATEESCVLLPECQAIAAARAMGQTGKELQLCYRDDGGERVQADWTVRETG